jgi:hypothetical protein
MTNRFSPGWWSVSAALICWISSAAPVCAGSSDLREAGDVLQIAMPDRYRTRTL